MDTSKLVSRLTLLLASGLSGALAACGGPIEDPGVEPDPAADVESEFSSDIATPMNFQLDGELLAPSSVNPERYVEDQLLYSIGQLNGNASVGRLDALTLSNVTATREGIGYRVRYRAMLPVSWGSKTNLPTTYTLILPRAMNADGLTAFTNRYMASCAEAGAHDVDSGSFWYYYRPSQTGCALADIDVVRLRATVTTSSENTNGRYPEYHKVWEDNALVVVAIFGKYEDGATTAADAGVSAFNTFVAAARRIAGTVTVTPANLPTAPGVANPDVTVEIVRADGRRVRVHALLVDNVVDAGPSFDARYGALSTEADLIAYNGHAGLGQNVRALTRKGTFRAGKYQIVFMNGCDTFAYVDGSLAEARARLNPDDPTGTRYMDMITNGRPSYFVSNTAADMALINGLLAYNAPVTYQTIFRSIDRQQVVVVTGEEDNVYVPGYNPGGPTTPWAGLDERGSVGGNEVRRYTTPTVPAGTYLVTMRHDPASPGGDADLFVRGGSAPTDSAYDCRPYSSGSDEECRVTLAAPAAIHIMVRGYSARANAYLLTARPETVTPPPPPPATWAGFNETGTVSRNQEVRLATPSLPAGRYTFAMTGTGDADLYVRSGSAPTTTAYDCRPYAGDANETCTVTLTASAVIHVMVRGYSATTSYTLAGRREP